ncbi:hypothetical protein Cali_32 [Mycobacterium phage Cali]|uniref:Uncharacterized protein n=7 Tax=Bixzunavirus TaxID=680114 RepID=G1BST2_9CAUD|nr:gp32 [Mycobacterium phage Cali]YP_009204596.1 hypothetical protein HYRO_31 [Mycobacterium phage HyRo]YP_010056986.1 hypothetical protein KHO58_gp038 [Mycobacterium phage Bigswole]YP_010057675.1 hypothetical protein KHO61_gp035 [Mycobacterium phage Mangeria]AEK06842.1 hypothetical protein DRAZDYS_32 [Mycobacterium phage Drazdys]ANT41570.1 hypothetical protein PBI_LITTLETON_32 [Mycobacterium phage Littleton]ATN87486.1 hypothetical protein SEA_BEANWATER_28 [Mycobacterium phage BeanWater]AYD8
MSTPAKYRKKPVVVEALQWTGDNAEDLAEWATMPCHGAIPGSELICFMSMDDDEIFDTVESMRYDEFRAVGATAALWVNANQSWLPIKDGEWVVKDRLGFYPVEDGVFAETYELVP